MAKEAAIKVNHFCSQRYISVMSDWINRFLGIKSKPLCKSIFSCNTMLCSVFSVQCGVTKTAIASGLVF